MAKLNALIAGSTGYIGVQLIKLFYKQINTILEILSRTFLLVFSYGNLLINQEFMQL